MDTSEGRLTRKRLANVAGRTAWRKHLRIYWIKEEVTKLTKEQRGSAVIGLPSIETPTSQAEYPKAPRASHEAPAEAPRQDGKGRWLGNASGPGARSVRSLSSLCHWSADLRRAARTPFRRGRSCGPKHIVSQQKCSIKFPGQVSKRAKAGCLQ